MALNYVDAPVAEWKTDCGWLCGRSVYKLGTKVDTDEAECEIEIFIGFAMAAYTGIRLHQLYDKIVNNTLHPGYPGNSP